MTRSETGLHLDAERIRAILRDARTFDRGLRDRKLQAAVRMSSRPVAPAPGETLIDARVPEIDAVAGEGAGRYLADSTRLLTMLGVLAGGPVEDEIGRARASAARGDAAAGRWLAWLRSILPGEVDSVLGALDDIALAHPELAAVVRNRHRPRMSDTDAPRAEPSRPALTVERIRETPAARAASEAPDGRLLRILSRDT